MTDPPTFDRVVFERRLGGDRALALEVMRMFVEDCPQRMAAIRRAVAEQDAAGLQVAAHTLKGSAGYLSAAMVVEAAARLEHIGREGDLGEAAAALEQLETAVTRLVPALAREVQV
jgi:HPt (histidine-containing phosphotransfer) domain-containing protein